MAMNENLVKKPKKSDELLDDDEDEIELDDDKEDEKETKRISFKPNDPKKRMLFVMGIIVGGLLLLFIILFLVSTFSKKVYTYDGLESVLKSAAISYFQDHKDYLPKEDGDVVEVDSANLIAEGKMNDLSEYNTETGVCSSASVQVEKTDDSYLYTPYINCGENYSTQELYKLVTSKVVNEGYGVYQHNEEYAYRGENVNNFVQLGGNIWRIVKVTSNHNVVLISADALPYSYPWDNRYNTNEKFESGINDFAASRIKDSLTSIYVKPNEKKSENILTDSDKSLLITTNLCIGKRAVTSEGKDNVEECGTTISNQRMGLLTLSDYMYASVDANCKTSENKSCKNYNYLVLKNSEWWLLTPDSGNTSNVFVVRAGGNIIVDTASSYCGIRPVITLNSKVMYKSGKGTYDDPYLVK